MAHCHIVPFFDERGIPDRLLVNVPTDGGPICATGRQMWRARLLVRSAYAKHCMAADMLPSDVAARMLTFILSFAASMAMHA
jgi:hypothetical protein